MTVRSRHVFGPTTCVGSGGGGTTTTLYTVPAGRTLILRNLYVRNDVGHIVRLALTVGAALVWWDGNIAASPNTQAPVSGGGGEVTVWDPGEVLKAIVIDAAAGSLSITGWGTLLEGAPA